MKRYWQLTGLMMLTFLALFGLAEWLHVPLLTDPDPWMKHGVLELVSVKRWQIFIDVRK